MMAYTNLNGVDPSRFTGLRGWGEFRGHSFEVNTSLTLINRVWHLAGPSLRASVGTWVGAIVVTHCQKTTRVFVFFFQCSHVH